MRDRGLTNTLYILMRPGIAEDHVRMQPIRESLIMAFFGDTPKVDACAQATLALKGFSSNGDYNQQAPFRFTGLHFAAYFGLGFMIQHLNQFHERFIGTNAFDMGSICRP